jgi:hypothetical protein
MTARNRNLFISLAVAVCILFSGGLLFRGSEAIAALTMIASFGIGQVVLFVLDARERRREDERRRLEAIRLKLMA